MARRTVIWFSAAFDIEYAIDEPIGRIPAIDVIVTTLPSSESRR